MKTLTHSTNPATSTAPVTGDDSTFLRRILLTDAATSGAMGLLLVGAAGWLQLLLGLPVDLLRGSGVILLPFALGLIVLATRSTLPAGGVWTVVALNAFWTVASLLLLLQGPVEPTALGQAFVLLQAFVVAVFAGLETLGWRRLAPR